MHFPQVKEFQAEPEKNIQTGMQGIPGIKPQISET
jgi:hypothetical protein